VIRIPRFEENRGHFHLLFVGHDRRSREDVRGPGL